MSLQLIRSPSSADLWEACAESFLDEIGTTVGPDGFPAMLWIAHRAQRDSLLERAARSGLPGWLGPPIRFLSELPELFGIEGNAIGPLARRLLLAGISSEMAARHGFSPGQSSKGAAAAMLDTLFGELLPEAVDPRELEPALEGIASDDFSGRRNRWIVGSLTSYLEALASTGLYDARAIHGIVAERIETGGFRDVLGGARRLHVYGVHSLRSRRRLFEAIAAQTEVEACLYLPSTTEGNEWSSIGVSVEEHLGASAAPASWEVQPAPDAIRELHWVARRIKQILLEDPVQPHEIAVVARSGREDTGRAYRALQEAGIPASARIRTPLSEIPALKVLLGLFRGAAAGWPYRPLRHVITSPYFAIGVDPSGIDFVAEQRRVRGLDAWIAEISELCRRFETGRDWELKKRGLWRDRLGRDLEALRRFSEAVARFDDTRSERDWIRVTQRLLRGDLFRFRRRVCRPVAERWDIVRLDQRGVLRVEALLAEWAAFGAADERIGPAEFHGRLRHLLSGNELSLSTPAQKGVQVLEAHEAAMTPFSRTFLIHANDREFPRAHQGGGVLSDEERIQLREAGIPVSHSEEALRRERDLWRSVTNGGSITVTYRTTDSRGTPRLPSPMVPPHDAGQELPRALELEGDPISPADDRYQAAAELARLRSSGSTQPLGVAEPERLRHAVLGAYAEARRGNTVPNPADAALLDPSPWNGLVRDPVVLESVRKRFGPDYRWSANQLQLYARCPFFFFMERVLRLSELAEAEEETTPLTFGGIAHSVLERFYRSVGGDPPPSFDVRAQEALERAAREVFEERESGGDWLGLRVLWEVKRDDVLESVGAYLRWELPYMRQAGEIPHRVELSFGFGGDGASVVLTGLDLADVQRRMSVIGRIDRVDGGGPPGAERYAVIDYKWKNIPSARGYQDGVLVQTPLYMKVLREHYGLAVESGRFRSIKEPKERPAVHWGDPEFDRALRIAFTIPERARSGRFEAVYASSEEWKDWYPGRDVCRTRARREAGSRFDG